MFAYHLRCGKKHSEEVVILTFILNLDDNYLVRMVGYFQIEPIPLGVNNGSLNREAQLTRGKDTNEDDNEKGKGRR